MVEKINKMNRTDADSCRRTGKEPTDDDLAVELGTDPQEVQELRRIALRTTSLETPVGDEGDAELGDFVQSQSTPDPVDLVSRIVAEESLARVLETMEERERKVIELRFGFKGEQPRTLAEVSARFNVSRERIRQIEAVALKKIKWALETQATGGPATHSARPRRPRTD